VFEIVEGERHDPLKSGFNILKAKRNFLVCECTPRTYKRCFMLVLGLDLNLVIPGKKVHKRKDLTTYIFNDNLVNEWGWKIIFRASFVHIMKVHTHTDRTLFSVDRNKVRHPFRQLQWIDETNLYEFLYLNLDGRYLARIDWVKLLSDKLNIEVSCNLIFNFSWVSAWNLLIRPGKNVAHSSNNSV
jgi:hypothetical protein